MVTKEDGTRARVLEHRTSEDRWRLETAVVVAWIRIKRARYGNATAVGCAIV